MHKIAEVKDLASTTEAVLNQAIEYCAQKVRPDNAQAVIERLRKGDSQVCEYCNYSLAKQVAASLGALDRNILAVYAYDYDTPADDYYFGEAGRALPIHLIVWAKRKTAALDAVVVTWDRALARRYAELVGGHQPAHLLDVQVVDDTDVVKRIGYGAMLTSLHRPPTEVWKR
jgi:hypothetical protein